MKTNGMTKAEKLAKALQIVGIVLCAVIIALTVRHFVMDSRDSDLVASVRADVSDNVIAISKAQEEVSPSERNDQIENYEASSSGENIVVVTGNSEEFIVCAYNAEADFSVSDNSAVKVAHADNVTEDLGHYEMRGNQCEQVATLDSLDANRTDGVPNFS